MAARGHAMAMQGSLPAFDFMGFEGRFAFTHTSPTGNIIDRASMRMPSECRIVQKVMGMPPVGPVFMGKTSTGMAVVVVVDRPVGVCVKMGMNLQVAGRFFPMVVNHVLFTHRTSPPAPQLIACNPCRADTRTRAHPKTK